MDLIDELFELLFIWSGESSTDEKSTSHIRVNDVLNEICELMDWDVETERVPSFAVGSINPDDVKSLEPPAGRIVLKNPQAQPREVDELIDSVVSERSTWQSTWSFVRIERPEPSTYEWIVARERDEIYSL